MADFFKKCRAKARTGNIAVFLTSFDQILKVIRSPQDLNLQPRCDRLGHHHRRYLANERPLNPLRGQASVHPGRRTVKEGQTAKSNCGFQTSVLNLYEGDKMYK